MKLLYIIIICVLVFVPMNLKAQNIGEDFPKAIELMKKKKWKEAQRDIQKIVDKMGDRGEALFKDKFGVIYYHKGYCELKIARASEDEEEKKKYFQLASESMKECFEINMRFNELHTKSLLYRAQAEQGLGNMALAIELNKLFMSAQRP